MGLKDDDLFKYVESGDSFELVMAAKCSFVSTLQHQLYGQSNVHYLSQLVHEDLIIDLP